ncbi:MAG: tetratricopeptide repeat protein, partial [Methanophagales archaeon]|nr:tetratricopeptide repeat protein [Methanophagales archaeon]
EIKEDERGDFRSCIEPNCGMFLQWLASGKPRTKTLLTSRLHPKELDGLDGCLRKDLEKMEKKDAVAFFHRQGVVKGTRAEIETACESVGYHPLSLRLLSGLIVRDPKNPGDIREWLKYNLIPELKGKEGHNILELAYNSLDTNRQRFISRLSAFRNHMDYDAISIFNDFGSEEKFNDVLLELVDRGMLFRDEKSNKFDLHPIVRRYCYDRLKNKESIHLVLTDYFAYIPAPEKIGSLDDLAPVIELYHHTVRAGRYDEAYDLYTQRLSDQLYYTFGAYDKCIELVSALFHRGLEQPPRLKSEAALAYMLNHLALSYSLLGQCRRAVPLFKKCINIYENTVENKDFLAVGLGNFALMAQIPIGELDAAESNLRRSIEICREIKEEFDEASGHEQLATLLAFKGKYEESENEDEIAMKIVKNEKIQWQCQVWISDSRRFLLTSNTEKALKSAITAYDIAYSRQNEVDRIRCSWLLGATNLLKGNLVEAEKHLTEALTQDRKINLVELEPDILLEFAKLHFKQNHKEEALKFAEEALQIADRCEYRLKQADIHNFFAEFFVDAGDLEKAREHGEVAKERAECGYKVALEKAEEMLNDIEQM